MNIARRTTGNTRTSGQSGFTLLELLVVIAIIAILAAVVITNLNSAQAKAKDTRVRTDLNSLQQAVNVGTTTSTTFAEFDTDGADNITKLETAVKTKNLIPKMPKHPVDGKAYHYYSDDKAPADGVLDYLLYGELSTGSCFIVKDGSSFEGNCTTDIAF